LARWLIGDPHALALSRCVGGRNSGASIAYVEKNGSGYREIPVPWNPTI
jgi:hypothetical protein